MSLTLEAILVQLHAMPPHARGRRFLEKTAQKLRNEQFLNELLVKHLSRALSQETWSVQ